MSQLRRFRRQKPAPASSVLGVAWFDPLQYERLLEVAADRAKLFDRHEDWLANAERAVARIPQRVKKVFVEVDAWVAWCQARELAMDSASRSRYVAELVREQPVSRQK